MRSCSEAALLNRSLSRLSPPRPSFPRAASLTQRVAASKISRKPSLRRTASLTHTRLPIYRAFYIVNWIYRYWTEPHYSQWISWVTGVIQTAFYLDFFYYFYKSKTAGLSEVVLPL